MKKILILLLLCSTTGFAQFIKADLMASGLTCSMCNLATQKQLQSLDFIDSIVPDLELNAFHIYFNTTREIDFGLIRKKVEDAGFFVAGLKVFYKHINSFTYKSPFLITHNSAIHVNGFDSSKSLQVFKFIDEGYVTSKEYKKYRKIIKELELSSNSKDVLNITNLKTYYVQAL